MLKGTSNGIDTFLSFKWSIKGFSLTLSYEYLILNQVKSRRYPYSKVASHNRSMLSTTLASLFSSRATSNTSCSTNLVTGMSCYQTYQSQSLSYSFSSFIATWCWSNLSSIAWYCPTPPSAPSPMKHRFSRVA